MLNQSSLPNLQLGYAPLISNLREVSASPVAVCDQDTCHVDPPGQTKFDGVTNAGETASWSRIHKILLMDYFWIEHRFYLWPPSDSGPISLGRSLQRLPQWHSAVGNPKVIYSGWLIWLLAGWWRIGAPWAIWLWADFKRYFEHWNGDLSPSR